MSTQPATSKDANAAGKAPEQPQQQQGNTGQSVPLVDALRSGDREAVEAIVHKLSDQLETLKVESAMAAQESGPPVIRHADTAVHRLVREETPGARQRPLSTSVSTTSVHLEMTKRASLAFGPSVAETAMSGPVCAYCGTLLDEGTETATKATLNSEIGYCCSNCEGILSVIDDEAGDKGSLAASSLAAAGGAPQLDSDYVSLNAFNIDDDAINYFESAIKSESQSTSADSKTLCDFCHSSLGEGRRFHVTHFACEDCNIPLYALGGYLQDPMGGEKFYCQRDYLQRFSPICHACSVQITSGEMAIALGRTYHSDCFVCSICQSPFIGDVCYEHDGQPLFKPWI
ncbi:hypothetical protein GQ54DRAFT_109794 [Martensiomyces pterosporus]|nr:hypothetical protein GQ54DRAFT_109794 [Martensiomyces pterosporus]